ncbi:hypothetical protein MLD38_032924 [Melastoma candidum]|uniref:Uncharacterized protein n=1 Tax=Melastoma candidum TaxID=119954 RepID=A0ACB9M5P3_9MYRT|nr:hypothetical protein MLD38_032924 [Melastoma candidum]
MAAISVLVRHPVTLSTVRETLNACWRCQHKIQLFESRSEVVMVSLRRRRLLGLCSGRSCFLDPIIKSTDGIAPNDSSQSLKAVAVHPLPLQDSKQQDDKPVVGRGSESSHGSGFIPLVEPCDKLFPEPAVKRRKPHRRKHRQNQEPCLMRGVYFKNMKWQAAIKVDKKQIHLGTVGSQVEAAHLYDRAAFMCGREPNFELPEEEKRELRELNWDEFLAMTRHAITNKTKEKGRSGIRDEVRASPGEWDSNGGGHDWLSTSGDAEPEGREP